MSACQCAFGLQTSYFLLKISKVLEYFAASLFRNSAQQEWTAQDVDNGDKKDFGHACNGIMGLKLINLGTFAIVASYAMRAVSCQTTQQQRRHRHPPHRRRQGSRRRRTTHRRLCGNRRSNADSTLTIPRPTRLLPHLQSRNGQQIISLSPAETPLSTG